MKVTRFVLPAVVALGIALSAAPAHAAGAPCEDPANVGPVELTTIPVVPGAVVTFDGEPVALSAAGTATPTVCREGLVARIRVDREPVALTESTRARYDRVMVSSGGRVATLAFHVDYLTDVVLNGVPADEIESFTLRSSTGERITKEDQEPIWLWGDRVIRGPAGLLQRGIFYTVDNVIVHGGNVVTQSRTKFYPNETSTVDVPLLTFNVDLSVRDRLFGFPMGTTAYLEAPDGTVIEVPLESGKAAIEALPRGTYTLSVDAPGLDTPRPLSVSRDQVVDLPVMSYLDLGVILGLPALLAGYLILMPRPHLRSRLASPFRRLAPIYRRWRRLTRVTKRPVGAPAVGEEPVGAPAVGEEPVGAPAVGEEPAGAPAVGEEPVGAPAVGEEPREQPRAAEKNPQSARLALALARLRARWPASRASKTSPPTAANVGIPPPDAPRAPIDYEVVDHEDVPTPH